MTRKKSVLAWTLAFGLLMSACGGRPLPAPAADSPDDSAPAVFSAAPAMGEGETAAPLPPAEDAPSAPEQDRPGDPIPSEPPVEVPRERSGLPSPSSDSGEEQRSAPPQSSLPDENASPAGASRQELPPDGGADQADAQEAPTAQEQGDPPGSRWMTISEAAALTFINKERGLLGVQPLTFDPDLTAAARVRAAEMFRGNYVSHFRPDGSPWETVLQADVPAAVSLAAENRAWTDHAAGQDVPPFQWFQMWKNNEDQYAVMTDPRYTHCGVAVLAGPYFDGEQSYAVALFGSY